MRFQLKLVLGLVVPFGSATYVHSQESSTPGGTALTSSGELVRSTANLSTQANYLNQNQWIRITDEGSIRGSVSLLVGSKPVRQGKVKVSLIQDGKVVSEALSDVEGDFMIEKAGPGVYSLVALGERQIAVCALTVLSKSEGRHLPDRIHLRTLGPASQRVAELIRANTMPNWTVGRRHDSDPIAPIRNSQSSCDVMIDGRGGVSGTLSRANASVDLSSTVVHLIQEGQPVARTRATSNGSYRFENVRPGAYGLVASGAEGIVALGFTAVANKDGLVRSQRADEILVTTRDGKLSQDVDSIPAPATIAKQLNAELAEPNSLVPGEMIPAGECTEEELVCSPAMGCCPGNSGGGGGGGGGTGGMDIGTLAALGALAAVAIAQAMNEDDAPVSPVVPAP
jgi:hypothetical protein